MAPPSVLLLLLLLLLLATNQISIGKAYKHGRTWPSDAAATGCSLMLEKTASRGRPSCSWMMANASSSGKGGTSSCKHASSQGGAHLMSQAAV
jgi:hypothetical protein